MKIFLTGGTGGIGKALILEFLRNDHELIILSHGSHLVEQDPRVTVVRGDVLNPGAYSSYMKAADVVLHMAAVTHTNSTAEYYEVNETGTRLLIESAERSRVKRFIFISTRARGKEAGAYGDSKQKAEHRVIQSACAWTIVRLAEVYGIKDSEAITDLIKKIATWPVVPIIGNGLYTLMPVHISDVIKALIRIVEKETTARKIYNIFGPEELTYVALVEKICVHKNIHKPKVHIPLWLLKIVASAFSFFKIKNPPLVYDQIPRLVCKKENDISLAVREIDFRPKKIEEMLFSPHT